MPAANVNQWKQKLNTMSPQDMKKTLQKVIDFANPDNAQRLNHAANDPTSPEAEAIIRDLGQQIPSELYGDVWRATIDETLRRGRLSKRAILQLVKVTGMLMMGAADMIFDGLCQAIKAVLSAIKWVFIGIATFTVVVIAAPFIGLIALGGYLLDLIT